MIKVEKTFTYTSRIIETPVKVSITWEGSSTEEDGATENIQKFLENHPMEVQRSVVVEDEDSVLH